MQLQWAPELVGTRMRGGSWQQFPRWQSKSTPAMTTARRRLFLSVLEESVNALGIECNKFYVVRLSSGINVRGGNVKENSYIKVPKCSLEKYRLIRFQEKLKEDEDFQKG